MLKELSANFLSHALVGVPPESVLAGDLGVFEQQSLCSGSTGLSQSSRRGALGGHSTGLGRGRLGIAGAHNRKIKLLNLWL
ncbi:hypothetical [Prochlorococcus marinus str. MIT 9313]|uniref:Uncharacterized protein n=1 Tax=Prochlorococcus marinus (strain MIT 9313) TaxID=74547 RepID=Q7V655_PROMM|nr:hypothetical [Prochlorococcus marinus str. MIT 9313]